jgi:phage gp46-like protein
MSEQQGDVVLFQSLDDGDIQVEGGIVTMDGGLQTAAYLSLFGGNEDDDGRAENSRSWWGNSIGDDPNEAQVSRTQNLLRSIPTTSSNLIRIQDAATEDLTWLVETKVATSVAVSASIPGLNSVKLVVAIVYRGEEIKFEFVENWKASR